ncbi:MAG: hypothetical protein AMJ46_01085 [Latescibacteria bacterium DG_63]|nr:MAG: hypothetical protein AMJ46_01085 [Latescibacteria bacterium DG_63]
MRLYEFEGKELFGRHSIPTPKRNLAPDAESSVRFSREMGFPAVLKVQVLTGGRGRAGGVKIVRDEKEVLRSAKEPECSVDGREFCGHSGSQKHVTVDPDSNSCHEGCVLREVKGEMDEQAEVHFLFR